MCVAHAIGGFGRIREVAAADVLLDRSSIAPLAAAEAELLARVNSRLEGAGKASRDGRRGVGLDIEGIDIMGPDGLGRRPWSYIGQNEEECAEAIVCAVGRAP